MAIASISPRRIIIAAAVGVAAFVSMACECRVVDVAEQWREADVVFRGRAISTSVDGRSRVAVLRVEEGFKNVDDQQLVTLFTSPHGAACGMYFEVGKEYMIYGSYRSTNIMVDTTYPTGANVYSTGQCSSEEWTEAAERAAQEMWQRDHNRK